MTTTSKHQPVIVGVDGSAAGQAAVAYAVEAAARARRPLRLVTAIAEALIPLDMRPRTLEGDWEVLREYEKGAVRRHPTLDVASELVAGDAVGALLDRGKDAELLVVGKRGLGTFARVLLGSVSTGVAGRSRVPTVVVPTGWSDDEHLDGAVVVGVDLEDGPHALRAGFQAAAEHGARLDAVHAIDLAPQLTWDADLSAPTYQHWPAVDLGVIEEMIGPLSDAFPDVEVTVTTARGDAATVLLDRARTARLLVMGRGDSHRYGFGLGSRTRAVLHYAAAPVLVVPTSD